MHLAQGLRLPKKGPFFPSALRARGGGIIRDLLFFRGGNYYLQGLGVFQGGGNYLGGDYYRFGYPKFFPSALRDGCQEGYMYGP